MRRVLYVLGQLSDDNIEWMIAHGERRQVTPGTVLIEEGKPTGILLIVLDGTLGVYVGNKLIATRGSGEILGEMSFVEDRAATATIKAEENTVLYIIPQDRMAQQLETDRDFAARFYRGVAISLSYRLRESMEGTGPAQIESLDDIEDDELLDDGVLDNAYLAGMRFERIVQRMMD